MSSVRMHQHFKHKLCTFSNLCVINAPSFNPLRVCSHFFHDDFSRNHRDKNHNRHEKGKKIPCIVLNVFLKQQGILIRCALTLNTPCIAVKSAKLGWFQNSRKWKKQKQKTTIISFPFSTYWHRRVNNVSYWVAPDRLKVYSTFGCR